MSRTYHHGDRAKLRLYGERWWWYRNEPKWWRKMYHTRPKRRENTRRCKDALHGIEEQVWPLGNRKPHVYYW